MKSLSKFLIATALFMGLITAIPAQAKVETYKFEKPHTQIGFYASHLGFSHSHGRFMDFDGSLKLDRDNPENSKVSVTIDATSLDMNDKVWTDHVQDKLFDVQNYPEIKFESTNVLQQGDNKALVTGQLTMLGKSRAVILNVKYNKSGSNPYSGVYTSGFSATASIQRSNWGMDYGLPGIGDEVEIRIEVEAQCQSGCPDKVNE